MTLLDLKNKLVGILGYGMEGKAVAAYLLKHGIKPVLFDQKPWKEWSTEEQEAIKALGVNFIFGPDYLKELKGFNVAFRSPGIRLIDAKTSVSGKTLITSQAKFFFDSCPAKIIGITGTKGKGTTSALTYEVLKTDGKNVFLTGNIGKIQPLEILDQLSANDFVVYELSSFQLQDLHKSPHIGVVLMTTSEHLDHHKDQAEYLEAKSAITKFQDPEDFAIINADYKNSLNIGSLGKGKKLYFSRQKTGIECFIEGADIIITGSDFKLPISSLQLRGLHNLENIMAAVLASRCAGSKDNAIKAAVAGFKGLEHRLEFVAEKQNIKFYDDSFSTVPETSIAGVKSFSEPLIIILGGSAKESDFSELGKVISEAKNIKAIVLIGAEANKIKKTFNFTGRLLERAKNMDEIFLQIKTVAEKGDVVLLSPACASFDMFKNYKDRGEQFKEQVSKW